VRAYCGYIAPPAAVSPMATPPPPPAPRPVHSRAGLSGVCGTCSTIFIVRHSTDKIEGGLSAKLALRY
jgi:hypothetical protein